jgi:hypothetical protein
MAAGASRRPAVQRGEPRRRQLPVRHERVQCPSILAGELLPWNGNCLRKHKDDAGLLKKLDVSQHLRAGA